MTPKPSIPPDTLTSWFRRHHILPTHSGIASIIGSVLFFIVAMACCLLAPSRSMAQDTLLFQGKWKFPVNIEEENEYQVIYRKADLKNSPLYVIEKRFITDIRYQDSLAAAAKFKPRPFDGSNIDLWVKPLDSSAILLRGRLLHMDDTMLMVRHRGNFIPSKPKIRSELVSVISYDHIQRLEFRKRNKMRKSAIIGAATGFVAGTLTGLLFFNDTPACENGGIDGKPPCDPNLKSPMTRFEKSLILGAGTAAGGFLSGGIIGGVRIKFIIGGNKDRYNQAIPHILKSLN